MGAQSVRVKCSAQTSSRSGSRQERRLGITVCLERDRSPANTVNKYISRDVRGGLDVLGIANTSASVAVNSAVVDDRREEDFRKQVTVTNANVHKWMQNQKQLQAQ